MYKIKILKVLKSILALYLIILFLLQFETELRAENQRSCSLTLIPPSPVSNMITIEIRGAIWNRTDHEKNYDVSVFLDNEDESGLLHREKLSLQAKSSAGISFRRHTKDYIGKHQIIFIAKSGNEIQRTVQPLEVTSRVR